MRWLLTIILLAVAGCATTGQESLSGRSQEWPPIGTAKSELLHELGPPNTSTYSVVDGKSSETLTWVYAHAESSPALWIPIVGLFVAASGNGITGDSRSLAVILDQEGKVMSRSWGYMRIGGGK
jgi:hypothetical protein